MYCADRTPRTDTVQASQSQGNPTFVWSYPSGWTVQGPANGASIVLVPSGTSGGSVSAQAVYGCTNPATYVASTALAVAFSANLSPVVFTNLPNLCDGQTATLRAAAVPGAQDYQWTLPVSFLTPTTAAPTTPGGNVFVTSSPELQVTAHANRYDYGGVSVTLAVSGSGCGASAKTQSLIVGLGYRAVVGTSSPTSTYYSDQVCANQPIQFSADIEQQTTPATNYTWTVNGNVYFPAQGAPVLNTYTPPAGQSLQVIVTIDSPCGSLTAGRYLTTAGSVDGQPCDNYRTGRPQPTAAYPNPADNKLYVEQSGGTVTLRNSHSQLVLQEVAKPGRAQLNTNHLPTGLYFLEFTGPDGARVRQQIRIGN